MIKNSFIQSIVFITIVVILGFIIGSISENIAPHYPVEKFVIKNLLAKADSLEAIVVGNSHNRSIDLNTMGLNGFHVWQDGNDIFEIEYQLKALVPKLPKLKYVICSVPYFFFHWSNKATTIEDRSEIRRKYYLSIPSWQFIKNDFKNFFIGKMGGIIRTDHWEGVLVYVYRKMRAIPYTKNTYINPLDGSRLDSSQFTFYSSNEDLLHYTREYGIPGHEKMVKNMIENHPELPKYTFRSLVNILQFLKDQKIEVIFYTPPFFYCYSELFDKNIKAYAKKTMKKLQKQYGFAYYDFSEDPGFIYNHKYFLDDDHLNGIYGAPAFSQEFLQCLINDKVIPLDYIHTSARKNTRPNAEE